MQTHGHTTTHLYTHSTTHQHTHTLHIQPYKTHTQRVQCYIKKYLASEQHLWPLAIYADYVHCCNNDMNIWISFFDKDSLIEDKFMQSLVQTGYKSKQTKPCLNKDQDLNQTTKIKIKVRYMF